MEILQSPWVTHASSWSFLEWKKCSWCSEGTSQVSVCACCSWSCHWAPLKKIPALLSLHFPIRYFYPMMTSPWAFSSSGRKSQHSELFLLWGMFESLRDLYGPLLDCLQFVPVCLVGASSQGPCVCSVCWAIYSQSPFMKGASSLLQSFNLFSASWDWQRLYVLLVCTSCKWHGETSFELAVFISVEIVCNKHKMHLCIFPTCDFHKNRINFLLQWNWLEYRSTQLLIIVSSAGLRSGFVVFFLVSHISFKSLDTISLDDKDENKLCMEI